MVGCNRVVDLGGGSGSGVSSERFHELARDAGGRLEKNDAWRDRRAVGLTWEGPAGGLVGWGWGVGGGLGSW